MKRYIILVLLLMLIPMNTFALIGDVDRNDSVGSMDYILVKNHILGKSILSGDRLTSADVNSDGKVTSADYIAIKKIILTGEVPRNTTSISLNKTSINLEIGKSETIVAIVNSNNKTITWTSSNKSIATVSGGIVKGIKNGTVTITAKTGDGKTATCKVVVLTKEAKYCEDLIATGVKSLDYRSFINKFPNSDHYYAIKATHDCANNHKLPVKVTKGEYHIYKKDHAEITVQTSTNFNGSTIYIHDEFSNIYEYRSDHVFHIVQDKDNKCTSGEIKAFNNNLTSLVSNTGKFLVRITEQDGKTVWHRNKGGSSTVQDVSKYDIYRVYNGVLKDPMYWNYKGSHITYSVCPIPSNQLEFKNAIIKTITRDKCEKCDGYVKRDIRIERSNTKLYNIKHSYVDKNLKNIYTIHHPYNGFIAVWHVGDIVIEKCQIYPLHYETPSGGNDSTYDMYLSQPVNTLLKEVTMYEDSHGQMESSSFWSVWSSYGCKNLVIEDSKLNVISAHKVIYNLTVNNTTIGCRGVTTAGSGDYVDNKMIFENVTWKYGDVLIKLRKDYGSTWNGTITIKNSKVKNVPSSTLEIISMAQMNSNIGLYFGQPIYNPTKVTVDGLNITTTKVNKVEIIGVSKSEYENYYFKQFQHTVNKNEDTQIIKKNIIGSSPLTIRNYS